MRKLPLLVALSILTPMLAACGGDGDGAGLPEPTISTAELEDLEQETEAFVTGTFQAWPDVEVWVARLGDDVVFTDPTWPGTPEGKRNVGYMLKQWAEVTDYTIDVTGTFVTLDGTAMEATWPGLQPPVALPPDPPVASGMEVYRHRDGQTANIDIWYRDEDNVVYGFGCFADDGCPEFDETIDRYVAAWSSRQPDAVSALYADRAVFTDQLLGFHAEGADAIGELTASRFGSSGDVTIEVLDRYAWVDGHEPPTDEAPDQGKLVGVAFHFRASIDNGETTGTYEGVTTLELGPRDGSLVEADPDGLIHHEEIYHELAGLSATAAVSKRVQRSPIRGLR